MSEPGLRPDDGAYLLTIWRATPGSARHMPDAPVVDAESASRPIDIAIWFA
jgi:hypothetical protein